MDKKTVAIIILVLNIFFPGIGSLVGGKTKAGIWQIVLWVISIPLMLILIGILVYIAAWVWALITSLALLREAKIL